ncbi:GspH/FimT family pseudopilin [Simiduia agarivorans]|uniref:Type II secretion system protein H n=1 Tax=Simiduia agarivorans (strain DSM 21679 / JCM 13881 / BCRC 17597 / SA1) TaxID=1117647 RepID=K4KIR7_SIMAS|nr:GspH/FimT family pseudopilin [Simiduia agarivorans]AFU98921.1 fimbrial pilin related signal peptide protein [Simiduia agarivorans SA1 = DSM 21679]
MKKYSGFTVIELMVVVLIASVLLGVGIPSLTNFINERSLVADVSRLTTALSFARSESITRAANVSICPSSDGESCAAGQWVSGWILFRDRNGNMTPELGTKNCTDTEDCILRADKGLATNTSVTVDASAFGFNAQGERIAASATRVTLCHPNAKRVHQAVLAASGAMSITVREDTCP